MFTSDTFLNEKPNPLCGFPPIVWLLLVKEGGQADSEMGRGPAHERGALGSRISGHPPGPAQAGPPGGCGDDGKACGAPWTR